MRETAEVVRDLWRLYYLGGCKNAHLQPRIDKGKQRPSSTGLAEFNRKRHGACLRSLPGVVIFQDAELLADQQIQMAGSWTPAMQKEHNFQMNKVVRGAGEAYLRGGVLKSEKRLFKEVGKEHQAKRAKAMHQRHLAESRKMLAISPAKPLDFSLGLVTPEYFAQAGKSGSCLLWRAAVQVKRDVWISAEWERDEPLLANLLKWAIRLPASKWRLRNEWNSATYVAKQKSRRRSSA